MRSTNVLLTNADGESLKREEKVRLIGSKYLSTIGKRR